jgi:hypothetical protein
MEVGSADESTFDKPPKKPKMRPKSNDPNAPVEGPTSKLKKASKANEDQENKEMRSKSYPFKH